MRIKKIITIFTATVLLSLVSCEAADVEYSYSIRDALKISAYIFDENVPGNYYHDDETVYGLEALKLNEARLIAPIGAINMINLNIHLKFDGIIEVISENEDVQLSFNYKLTPWYVGEVYGNTGSRVFGFSAKLPYEGYIALNPLGSNRGSIWGDTGNWLAFKIGSEYYLDVNAYKFENEKSPVIRAQLKFVQLEDTTSHEDKDRSPCFSIEMVSYEYSDMYKIMDEIWDDE